MSLSIFILFMLAFIGILLQGIEQILQAIKIKKLEEIIARKKV